MRHAVYARHFRRGAAAEESPTSRLRFFLYPRGGQHLWEAYRQGLRELGYVEGQNIVLEPRWAEGRHARHHDLVADLVRLNVDVMVVAATPASFAAKAATTTIPVVFVAVADPVRVGLVASLARPGGNFTGLSLLTPELSGKRLELLMETLQKVSRRCPDESRQFK